MGGEVHVVQFNCPGHTSSGYHSIGHTLEAHEEHKIAKLLFSICSSCSVEQITSIFNDTHTHTLPHIFSCTRP